MTTTSHPPIPAQGLRYDPASQVTNILHQLTATSAQINQAAYTYNGVGNRTSLTDRRGAQAFGYDTLDRLTSASHPLLATPQAFAYDPVGNRTTGGSVVNSGNQLTADANFTYQYDDNGNLTRKTLLATGNFTVYTYDAENRLTKVEEFSAGASTPAATSTYRYDGLGRRIEKVANGQTKRYIYDGEDILLEYDGANVLQARYTHGPGIDEPIAVTKGGSTFFYHQDGLGSVTDLTDSAGTVAKSYAYDTYGNILESPGALDQPYTYTGREFDSESGLYYYRARYYDPTTGRFLQRDPAGLRGGSPSLYEYTRSNPPNLSDPSGLFAGQVIGGVIGGAYGFYNAYNTPGATTSQIFQSTAIGLGTGVLSTLTFGMNPVVAGSLFGGIAGGLANVLTQSIFPSLCTHELDPQSLAASIMAGMIGGFAGGAIAIVPSPLSSTGVPILTDLGVDIVSAAGAGAVAGYLDVYFQGLVQ